MEIIFFYGHCLQKLVIKSKDRDRGSNSLLRQGPSLKDNL